MGRYLALALAVLLGASRTSDGAELTDADKLAILKVVCEDELTKDAEGWVCRPAPSEETFPRAELRWSTAIQGKWFENEGEWLVSLAAPCIGGCGGVTHVLRKEKGRWRSLAQEETLVDEGCVHVAGMADGFDRIVCLGASGPHQGFMTELLEVGCFAKDATSFRNLLFQEHGGECWLAAPPAKAQYKDDSLSGLAAGEPGSDVAFTVRLSVRRLDDCDATFEEPEMRVTDRGDFLLRFVRGGEDIALDPESRAIAERFDWLPEEPIQPTERD